jgi:hypothetical protein
LPIAESTELAESAELDEAGGDLDD